MGTFDPSSLSTSAFSPNAFDFGGGSDTTPDSFAFAPATGVELSTLTESGGAIIVGLDATATVSISGGEYSIDLGAWTSADGTINDGQSIRVRGTSSASYATDTSVTVTIGGVPAIFIIQTRGLKHGGDDAPPPRRKKKKAPAKTVKPKRATLSLPKEKKLEGDVAGIYRELSAEPAMRERAQEIVQRGPSLSSDDEIALRLLHRELSEQIEAADEEAIQELLARIL